MKTLPFSSLIWALAVFLGLVYAVRPALATTIFVSDVALSNGSMTVALKEGRTTVKGIPAGQLDITANVGSTLNSGATFTMATWCVDYNCVDYNNDIYYLSSDSDVYALEPASSMYSNPPSTGLLTSAQDDKIVWLASYGNNHLTTNLSNQDKNDLSAAIQIAIWNVEYGYTYAGSDNTLRSDYSSVESDYNHRRNKFPVDSGAAALISINPDGSLSQGLIGFTSLPVPESSGPFDWILAALAIGAATLYARRLQAQRSNAT